MRVPRRTSAELLALGALVGVLLYFGLQPFDLRRPNQVSWNAETPSLSFEGGGIAYSRRELRLTSGPEGALSIEVWVVPSDPPLPARKETLLTLDDGSPLPLEITRLGRSLTLRYPLDERKDSRSYAISIAPSLERGREGYVAVTSGPGGTRMYIDGVAPERLRSPNALVDPRRGLEGRVVIGSSPRGTYGWKGEFRGLALYARTLGEAEVSEHALRVRAAGPRSLLGEPGLRALYAFDESGGRRVRNLVDDQASLEVPKWLWALRWDVLAAPPALSALRSPRFRQDVLLNLLGFVPLGALLASRMGKGLERSFWRRFGIACAGGALLSLGIELGQAMLPSRFSSLLDLLLNVAGTGLGAAGWMLLERLQTSGTLRLAQSSPDQ